MSETEREKLRQEIHNALDGDGWAYSNCGYDELVFCVEKLDVVVDLFERWRNAEIMGTHNNNECHCANPSYPLGSCSNCGGVAPST